jgi:hypothetical protein
MLECKRLQVIEKFSGVSQTNLAIVRAKGEEAHE